jgi:hypothetical protein
VVDAGQAEILKLVQSPEHGPVVRDPAVLRLPLPDSGDK